MPTDRLVVFGGFVKAHVKGGSVPEVGDALTASFEKYADSVGVITAASSVQAARAVLDSAVGKGVRVTSASPFYFNINGILYVATGSKGGDGVWDLRPLSMPEMYADLSSAGGTFTLSSGQYQKLCKTSLPQRPYRRKVMVTGQCWANVTKQVDIEVWVHGKYQRARFSVGEGSQIAQCIGVVPANTVPDVGMWLRGGGVGGTATVTAGDSWAVLNVLAIPDVQW